MEMQSSPSEEELLDVATRIAISASKPGKDGDPQVDNATINGLLAFIQSKRDVNVLLAFIMRQMSRGEIDRNTGSMLLTALKGKKVDEAARLLGYVKWIYEALDDENVRKKLNWSELERVQKFSELVDKIARVK